MKKEVPSHLIDTLSALRELKARTFREAVKRIIQTWLLDLKGTELWLRNEDECIDWILCLTANECRELLLASLDILPEISEDHQQSTRKTPYRYRELVELLNIDNKARLTEIQDRDGPYMLARGYSAIHYISGWCYKAHLICNGTLDILYFRWSDLIFTESESDHYVTNMDELKFSQNQLIERVNNLYYGIVRKTINKHNSETEKRREIIHEPMNVLSNITEKIMDKQLPRTTSAFVRACEIGEESIRYLTYSAALSLIADYRKEKRDALSQAYLVSDSHDQELSSDWKLGVTDSDETEKWTRAIELSNSLSNPIDRKILKLLSHGHTEKEIADLFRKSGEKVSIRTISRRKKLIKEKISKRNTKETDRKGVTKPFTTS